MHRHARTIAPLGICAAIAAAACGPTSSGTPAPAEGDPVAAVTFAPTLGVDLASATRTESGLYIRDLETGTGETIEAGDMIRVHYTGWLPGGTKFDSSVDRGEPIELRIGVGGVIPSWDEGIVGMRVGGRRQLITPPALAYGEQGAGDAIPPNAVLVFEVEALGIENEPAERYRRR